MYMLPDEAGTSADIANGRPIPIRTRPTSEREGNRIVFGEFH
jgi:hypothetical protein